MREARRKMWEVNWQKKGGQKEGERGALLVSLLYGKGLYGGLVEAGFG